MANAAKANDLVAQATKKANSGTGFFASLTGSAMQSKEDAVQMFCQAANLYKIDKKYREAGDAYVEAAKVNLNKLQQKHEASTNYVDAASAYKKVSPSSAIECYRAASDIQLQNGRFSMAAKQLMHIGEMYESEVQDTEKACAAYEQAADYYTGEDQTSSANKCLVKVAAYKALESDYTRAIELYEQLGTSSADSNLLKWSAKEYFFKAALCHLCFDPSSAQRAIERYQTIYPAFTDSRECRLVKDLSSAREAEDIDRFTGVVAEYDALTRLDSWLTTIILRIKKQMTEEDDDIQ